LPFGKGKAFLGNSGRAMNYVIGGWQLSNSTNWSSGLPWTPSTAECGTEQDVNICRPNKGSGTFHVGAGAFDSATHQVTFFTPLTSLSGPFADPGIGNLGNIGRNTFHGPHAFTSDLSLVKRFPITERVNAQFRMDAFNIFNHAVLDFSSQDYEATGGTCIDCGGNSGKIQELQYGTPMRQLQFAVRLDF